MKISIYLFLLFLIISSCSKDQPVVHEKTDVDSSTNITVKFPERAKDMTIYEVNIRQHTREGTFTAFQKDLPRLKDLGVDILWIMPIQPIGQTGRKGTLGSYYSIRDYKSVNPEFGKLEDFKSLVNEAHKQGFFVILDWVPNHTSWDNVWLTDHKEYYMTDSAAAEVGKTLGEPKSYYKKKGVGNLVYEADWDDIALLNHYNPATRAAMIDAMKFWITETDIDGFRTDHAGHEIPMFFWDEATAALNPLKDLFWLAEWDEPRMHINFRATYDWALLSLTSAVAHGKANAEAIHDHIQKDEAQFGSGAFRLNMINNHDENSWQGTVRERYGDGEKAFAVFSFVAYGTPMLYSGQEVGLDKRLKFFEKDSIPMDDPGHYFEFYKKLNELKANHPSLWNGEFGAMPKKLEDKNPEVFSFIRTKGDDTIIGLINMSSKSQQITLPTLKEKSYRDLLNNAAVDVSSLTLTPWQYYVLGKP